MLFNRSVGRSGSVFNLLGAAFLVLFMSLLSACGGNIDDGVVKSETSSQAAPQSSCIDPDKIDPTLMCTMDYTPVCGCDGKTYSNSCAATSAGVTRWTEGECEVAEKVAE